MARSVARGARPHLTGRGSGIHKCVHINRLRSCSKLDIVVVSIYFKVAHHSGTILSERQTVFVARRSYFTPITKSLDRAGVDYEPKPRLFMVEVPGTAPGSATATSCALYRYSQHADTLYICAAMLFLKGIYRSNKKNIWKGRILSVCIAFKDSG